MGNTQQGEGGSLCDFRIFSADDFNQTSFQRNIPRKKNKSHTSEPFSNVNSHPPEASIHSKEGLESEVKRRQQYKSHTCYPEINKENRDREKVNENDFRVIQKIGEGKYGKICLVKKEDQEEVFTMKAMCKKKISKHSIGTVMIEKEILQRANHPFIPKLIYSFENEGCIFLIIEYLEGGDLSKILHKLTYFSEEITKFYSAEILLALEYLHDYIQVIYNGLKPGNVFLDAAGHIKLVHFSSAQRIKKKSIYTNHETHHDRSASNSVHKYLGVMKDYFEFGCFVYELLTGKKPYEYEDLKLIEGGIEEVSDELEWPSFISRNARDFITRLLTPKIEERLGYNGIEEIKKHPFFSHINWEKTYQKSIYPPLIPSKIAEKAKEEEELESEQREKGIFSLAFLPEDETGCGDTTTLSEDLAHSKTIQTQATLDVDDMPARSS